MLIPVKKKELKEIREIIWEQNNRICPILKREVAFIDTVIDHVHATKAERVSEQRGTIRNAIEFRANAMEGKIVNSYKRYFGKEPEMPLPEFLRSLADYLEAGSYQDDDGDYYIHPNEIPKPKKLGKRVFNKIAKLYKADRK